MFTKAEEALIQELREQKAPLERWVKFFPQHKIVDLMEKPKEAKPHHYCGETHNFSHTRPAAIYIIGEAPSGSYVSNPEAYARSMKKGNIYKWDDTQDAFLLSLANSAFTTKEIIGFIEKKFGITRTSGAIHSRLSYLGYPTP